MKKVEPNREAPILGGTGETVDFSFEMQGDIMQNVISSIYSEREKTVVRELMANAFDAHIAGGVQDSPIHVYLPTAMDPTFIVRDFGVGMEHDFVMRLYSKLGYSTKSETNDQTGMFGVGSKSPLSISDTFTLRCFDKPGWKGAPHIVGETDLNETGRIRLYMVSVAETGVPKISHTFDVLPRDEDKVELGGTEVKVPIAYSDRVAVIEGLADQHFCWFDKSVEFFGAKDEAEARFYTSIVEISPGIFLADPPNSSGFRDEGSAFVRQGSAIYPLNLDNLTGITTTTRTFIRQMKSLGRHVMVELPIGTCDVTMAREAIRYTQASIANISKIVEDATESLSDKLTGIIGDAHSFPLAMRSLADELLDPVRDVNNYASLQLMSSLLPLVETKVKENYITWHATLPDIKVAQKVRDEFGNLVFDDEGQIVTEMIDARPEAFSPKTEPRVGSSAFPEGKVILATATVSRNPYSKEPNIDVKTGKSQFDIKFPHVFYVLPSHLHKWSERIQQHLKDVFRDAVLPNGRGDDGYLHVYIVRCPKRSVDEIIGMLDSRGVLFAHYTADALPELVGEHGKLKQYSRTSVYKWRNSGWGKDKIEPDYLKPAYYITRQGISYDCYFAHPVTKYDGAMTPPAKLGSYQVEQIIRDGTNLGILDKDFPIYRVTENQAAKIAKEAPDWIHLPTHVGKEVEARVATLNQDDAAIREAFPYMSSNEAINRLISDGVKGFPTPTSAWDYLSQSTLDTSIEALEIIRALADEHDGFFYCTALRTMVSAWSKKFMDPNGTSTKNDKLENLAKHIFGNVPRKTDISQALRDLMSSTATDLSGFNALFSSYRTTEQYLHARRYLKGWKAEGITSEPIVDSIRLNKRVTELVDKFLPTVDLLLSQLYLVREQKEAA
ncbi:MAG: hypothetical protein AB7U75_14355 [Hyphomicrobiaceae bacterium]